MEHLIDLKTKIIFDPPHLTRKHHKQKDWKVTVMCETVDQCEIDKYYAWFIKTRFNLPLCANLRHPHITIVNDKNTEMDMNVYQELKSLLNGKEMMFKYNPANIRSNGKHWWIRMEDSLDVQNIRRLLGLKPDERSGLHNPYFGLHLTLGLTNEKTIEHSKYILETIKRYNL